MIPSAASPANLYPGSNPKLKPKTQSQKPDLHPVADPHTQPRQVRPCPFPDACPGGPHNLVGAGDMVESHNSSGSSIMVPIEWSDYICAKEYTGAFCAR